MLKNKLIRRNSIASAIKRDFQATSPLLPMQRKNGDGKTGTDLINQHSAYACRTGASENGDCGVCGPMHSARGFAVLDL